MFVVEFDALQIIESVFYSLDLIFKTLFSKGRVLRVQPRRPHGARDPPAALDQEGLPLRQLRHGHDHPIRRPDLRGVDRVSISYTARFSLCAPAPGPRTKVKAGQRQTTFSSIILL